MKIASSKSLFVSKCFKNCFLFWFDCCLWYCYRCYTQHRWYGSWLFTELGALWLQFSKSSTGHDLSVSVLGSMLNITSLSFSLKFDSALVRSRSTLSRHPTIVWDTARLTSLVIGESRTIPCGASRKDINLLAYHSSTYSTALRL